MLMLLKGNLGRRRRECNVVSLVVMCVIVRVFASTLLIVFERVDAHRRRRRGQGPFVDVVLALDSNPVAFLAPLAFKQARTFNADRIRLRRLDLFEAAQRGPTFHGPDESHARCISRVWRKLSADDLVEKTELADERRVELDTLAHYRAVLANDTVSRSMSTPLRHFSDGFRARKGLQAPP